MSQRQHDSDDDNAILAATSPVRWSEGRARTAKGRGGGATSSSSPAERLEERVGALFRRLPEPPPLGPVAQTRVLARLRSPGGRPWFPRLAMGSSLGAVSLLLSGAVIAAGGVGAWWKLAHSTAAVAYPPPPSAGGGPPGGRLGRGQRGVGAGRPVPPTPVDLSTPTPEDTLTPGPAPSTPASPPKAESARQAATRVLSPARVVTPGPAGRPVTLARQPGSRSLLALVDEPRAPRFQPAMPVGPSSLGRETSLLASAMANLRRDEDPRAALVALEDYLRQFPNGMLIDEARRARVDALLMLDRKDDAQRALDALDLEREGRGLELRLIRGELRARMSCAQASQDFDAVLEHSLPPRLAERALFGRAVCRQRQGQDQGAREDAQAYLDRFPAGRFATAIRGIGRDGVARGAVPGAAYDRPQATQGRTYDP